MWKRARSADPTNGGDLKANHEPAGVIAGSAERQGPRLHRRTHNPPSWAIAWGASHQVGIRRLTPSGRRLCARAKAKDRPQKVFPPGPRPQVAQGHARVNETKPSQRANPSLHGVVASLQGRKRHRVRPRSLGCPLETWGCACAGSPHPLQTEVAEA